MKKKVWVSNPVALVHHLFRNGLGAVDQRDVKSYVMSLTREAVTKWHQKQIKFLVETAVAGAHSNYNIDPSTTAEPFTKWHTKFVTELLQLSKNYRKYKVQSSVESKDSPVIRHKRPHTKRTPSKRTRKRKKLVYGNPTRAGLLCYGRTNLSAYLDVEPLEGTEKNRRPVGKRIKCGFCGRDRVLHRCSACKEVFCMLAPYDLYIPGSNPPRKFPSKGLCCWQRIHGYETKREMRN